MSDAEDQRTAAIVSALQAHAAAPLVCSCGAALCGHELVVSHAMGFKKTPRCLACIAGAVGQTPEQFREEVLGYVERQDCWRTGWGVAGDQEQVPEPRRRRPPCLWPDDAGRATTADPVPEATPEGAPATTDEVWDAGEMSCGDLLYELRFKLAPMPAGATIRITATDVSAPIDIPAWCKLTRHALLAAEHPRYWIRRRRD